MSIAEKMCTCFAGWCEQHQEPRCECGHARYQHHNGVAYGLEVCACEVCGCPEYSQKRALNHTKAVR